MKLYPELLFKMNADLMNGSRKKLLVIDDDELFLKSLETVLADEYDLDMHKNPTIASEWIGQQNYDVVILDYNMEPFNGLEAIRKIRKIDHRTGMILITGYGTFDLAAEAMSLGVTALLSKPVQVKQLKDAIRTAIHERQLFAQLEKMESLSDDPVVSHHVLETQKKEIDKLKELLRWTYKQLEGTFNIIPDPMMVLDADLKIISLNQAAVAQFRQPQSELVGRHCYEAFGKKGIEECIECPARRVLSIGLPAHSMFAEKSSSPNYLVSAIPIVDEINQKLVSVVEIRHAVHPFQSYTNGTTAVTDTSGKLNELSEIRHEMNNMLTILRTVTEVLKISIEKDQWDRARDTLPLISENINRMANYLKGLTSKGYTPQNNIITVPEFVNRLIDTIANQPLYRPIKFEKLWQNADIRIHANEEHFQEIMINIFKNAAEAMGSGCITVSADACPHEQCVSIKITDNGPGISETILPRLFDEKITTKEKGNGYGLLIVKRLIEQNKGTVHVNLRPTGGTEFVLHFPSIIPEATPAMSVNH